MTGDSFIALFVLSAILNEVYCGSEPFNLFGLQLSKQTDVDNPDIGEKQEKLTRFEDDEPSEERNLKKKRLFLQDDEPQTDIHPDNYFMNAEYSSKRRNSQSKTEEHQQVSEGVRNYGNSYWDSERDRIRHSEEKESSAGAMGFRPRDPITGPNFRYDLEKGGNPERSQLVTWNPENNYKIVNPNPEGRVGSFYNDRAYMNDYSAGARDRNLMDRRISITTLKEGELRNVNRYRNDYKASDMRYGYDMHSHMDYSKRKDDAPWDPSHYKPEKGVIINFNTDCPAPRHYNNQLVHRVIVSPKSPVTQSEISTYQFPGSAIISAHQLAPAYY